MQRTLEKGRYSGGLEASQMYTDTAFIDSVRKRKLFSRRPDGHSFKAVDVIRNNFVSEDEYLIFDYCDGSDGGEGRGLVGAGGSPIVKSLFFP